jgi:thiomorpholine-carboxylate dehydrogenase
MHADAPPLYIGAAKVEELLQPEEVTPLIEKALIDFSQGNGEVVQPVRSHVPVEEHRGMLYVMPGYSRNAGSLACKLLTAYRGNPAKNLPRAMSNILLFDPTTGAVLAIMDGQLVSELRAAAASAVATKYMSSKDASILSILGSGAQARSHVKLLKLVRQFKEIRVWSPNPSHMQAFASEVGAVVSRSPEEAVHGADVIVTVTLATKPVLFGKWVKPGAHVNAVGACHCEWRELDDELMYSSTIVVDSREGASTGSGDVILSNAKIACEIGEVAAGAVSVDPSHTTVFKSLGIAIEDVVIAKLVYDKFKAQQDK